MKNETGAIDETDKSGEISSRSLVPRRHTSPLSTTIALLLAAVLLALAFDDAHWGHLLATLRQARLDYLIVAFCVFSITYFVRGIRWGVLLRARDRVPPLTMFWATTVGYMGNHLLPARAGEIIRAVIIGRTTTISKSYALATGLTERILDVPALIIMALIALMSLEGIPAWLLNTVYSMAALSLVAVGMLFVAPRLEWLYSAILDWLPLPEKLRDRLRSILQQFLLGMQAFQHAGRAASFLGLTVVVWLIDACIAIITAQALGLTLGLPEAMLLLAGLGLSSAAPSTPGYVGIYQFVAVEVLTPFGFSSSAALAYIIAYQGLSYLAVLVWGLAGLWQLGPMRVQKKPLVEEG